MSENTSLYYSKKMADLNYCMSFKILERRKRCKDCPESRLTCDHEGTIHMMPDLNSKICQNCLKERMI